MKSIHDVLAAAKRGSTSDVLACTTEEWNADCELVRACLEMAETLASIAANTCCDKCEEAALVARACLDKIVKEWQA